ncbi:hypothetical protein [Chitinophaga sp. Cy-1792]|uniref:hypothetical protein n=1 Tax=Chitinophaga sp. Cy-1792 TaxID=2608339 RepID=UPI001421A653|nr:hypothetical protein [Chitinophaga sp. Cy-1792]NIG55403.1 hypothetical protein [Chitinophaga sp. Cy-1792]
MTSSPFQTYPLRKPSTLQKFFKQAVEENAVIEINNLLAENDIKKISSTQIQNINSRYGIDTLKEFSLNMLEFYSVYLNFGLRRKLPDLKDLLLHLQEILQLTEEQLQPYFKEMGEQYYRQAVSEAIKDGTYSESDATRLVSLAQIVKLSPSVAKTINAHIREEALMSMVEGIYKRKRLSPYIKSELFSKAQQLGIELSNYPDTIKKLAELEHWWELENHPLTPVNVNIELSRQEECFFEAQKVSWFEHRVVRKGVSVPTLIKSGELYLTNKQLIFISTEGTSKIRLDKIMKLSHVDKGIEVIKDSGRHPTFHINATKNEAFFIILKRLVADHSSHS